MALSTYSRERTCPFQPALRVPPRSCGVRGAGAANLRATLGKRCSRRRHGYVSAACTSPDSPPQPRTRRDAGFYPSIRPQRRGGSRAAQTFVPVDPGRVILASSRSFRTFVTGYGAVASPRDPQGTGNRPGTASERSRADPPTPTSETRNVSA